MNELNELNGGNNTNVSYMRKMESVWTTDFIQFPIRLNEWRRKKGMGNATTPISPSSA